MNSMGSNPESDAMRARDNTRRAIVRERRLLLACVGCALAAAILGVGAFRDPHGVDGSYSTLAGRLNVHWRLYSPLIVCEGERLSYHGMVDAHTPVEHNIAYSHVYPYPKGHGLGLAPWFWSRSHGDIQLNVSELPPRLQNTEVLAAELARLRRQIAADLPWYYSNLPPWYQSAFRNGPGTTTEISWRGIAFDALVLGGLGSGLGAASSLANRGWRMLREKQTGVCPNCRYPLCGLKGDLCPECGSRFVR